MDVFVVMVGEGVGNMQCGTGSAQRESLSLLLLLLLVLLGVRIGVWVGCCCCCRSERALLQCFASQKSASLLKECSGEYVQDHLTAEEIKNKNL